MKKGTIVACALCASVTAFPSSGAFAGQGMDALRIAEHIFANTDVDNSGTVTLEEYVDAGLDKRGASFEDFDTDENEIITLAEYRSLFLRVHPYKKEQDA